MAPISLATLALVMMPSIGAGKAAGAAFLAVRLEPEQIARTLVGVEDEWKAQVTLFASCDSVGKSTSADLVECRRAPSAFAKSCETVVQAVTEGSSGDRDVVEEYMQDLCGQHVLKGWRQDRCIFLADTVVAAMPKDLVKPAVLDKKNVCSDIWTQFLSDEQVLRTRSTDKSAEDAKSEAERKDEANAKALQEALAREIDEAKSEAEADEVTKANAVVAKAKVEAEEATKATAKAAKARAEANAKADEAVAQSRAVAKEVTKVNAAVAKAKADLEEAAKATANAAKAKAEAIAKADEAEAKARAANAKAHANAKAKAKGHKAHANATATPKAAKHVASRNKAHQHTIYHKKVPMPTVNASANHTANATAPISAK